MKGKKGVSPLIATVLIIGFTIVIAALVITWGTNLFKKTQQQTGELSEINLACTEVLGGMTLTANVDPVNNPGIVSLTLDNGADREVSGFVVRVYSPDQTTAETFDTDDPNTQASITSNDGLYTIGASGLKTFKVSTTVDPVGKVGVRPKITIKGKFEQCPGEAEYEF